MLFKNVKCESSRKTEDILQTKRLNTVYDSWLDPELGQNAIKNITGKRDYVL